MRCVAVLALSVLLGCESEVYTPDGGSSEGGGVTTGTPSGGASNSGGGAPAFDAVAACEETCNRPCVGDPLICGEGCLAAITPNCERESFASYECSMWYCDPSCDAEELQSALFGCVNPFYCGHAGNEFACSGDPTAIECDCVGQCDEGHTGRIACSASGACDCYFDGELVATCSEESTYPCDFQASCCISYLLPGGGPAANGSSTP
jgi:hypothetical protein